MNAPADAFEEPMYFSCSSFFFQMLNRYSNNPLVIEILKLKILRQSRKCDVELCYIRERRKRGIRKNIQKKRFCWKEFAEGV